MPKHPHNADPDAERLKTNESLVDGFETAVLAGESSTNKDILDFEFPLAHITGNAGILPSRHNAERVLLRFAS